MELSRSIVKVTLIFGAKHRFVPCASPVRAISHLFVSFKFPQKCGLTEERFPNDGAFFLIAVQMMSEKL